MWGQSMGARGAASAPHPPSPSSAFPRCLSFYLHLLSSSKSLSSTSCSKSWCCLLPSRCPACCLRQCPAAIFRAKTRCGRPAGRSSPLHLVHWGLCHHQCEPSCKQGRSQHRPGRQGPCAGKGEQDRAAKIPFGAEFRCFGCHEHALAAGFCCVLAAPGSFTHPGTFCAISMQNLG